MKAQCATSSFGLQPKIGYENIHQSHFSMIILISLAVGYPSVTGRHTEWKPHSHII